MILLDDNFASIVNAIEEGRAVFGNIRRFLTYILTSNVPELVPYLAYMLLRIPLPSRSSRSWRWTWHRHAAGARTGSRAPARAGHAQAAEAPRRAAAHVGAPPRAYLWLGPLQAAAAMAM